MKLLETLLLMIVTVSLSDVMSSESPGVTSHEKVVICYWGTWANYRPNQGKFVASNVDGSLCTHLIYSFAGLDTNNWNIKTLDAWLDLEDNYGLQGFKKATDLRITYPHLKVMIAIGGWNEGSEKYSQMAADDEKRSKFVASTVEFLKKYKFDGLDLDWEYPGKRGGSANDKKNFIKLVKELREAFEEDKFLLTAAIGAAKGTIDISYDVAAMYKYLDYVNVMCYDYHGKWDKKTGHNAPLKPRPDETGDDIFFNLDYTIDYLIKKGASAEKTVLGVPLYGRAFLLSNAADDRMGAPAQSNSFAGPYTREAGFLGYNEICEELDKDKSGWEVKWEACHKAPYMVNKQKWVSYDNERSVKMKADLAWDKNLAGVMVWSIETDDFNGNCKNEKFPLLRALNSALIRRTEGYGAEDEGGECVAADYSTRRPVVTRKPWSPSVTPSSAISNDLQDDIALPPSPPSQPSSSGGVCVKPNEPNPDPSDCSKFYLCANGKPHPMSCREGTLYSASLMTCDHASNVHCGGKVRVSSGMTPRVRTVTGATLDVDNSLHDGDSSDVGNNYRVIVDHHQDDGLSSEKIAIIVLVLLLLAVCLLLSWCFRDRIKEITEPYLESFRGDKLKTPSALGLMKPYSINKFPWQSSNKTDLGKVTVPTIPSIPKVQIRNYHLRDLPPIPTAPSVPVPPPRRKKSVVEIQNFEHGLSSVDEDENSQSVA